MRRADLDAMARWGRHDDKLFAIYNVPRLTREEGDAYWERMTSDGRTLMVAADAGVEFVAHIIIRAVDRVAATGDLGIAVDPARIGQGLGRRVLRELFHYLLREEGLTTLTLDVAGYNRRAVRAYRAAGFAEVTRRFIAADMPIDFAGLLRAPGYEWLAPHVEVSGGSVKIEVLSMRAHLSAALEVEGQV